MFKIVIGNTVVGNTSTEIVAIFLNHIPVSHADVANKFSITPTDAGFATLIEDSRFLNVYGESISLNKSTDGIDKVKLNEKLKKNVFVQLPYHAFSYDFDVWISVPSEFAEQLVHTHDNFASLVTIDFDSFDRIAEETFKKFFA